MDMLKTFGWHFEFRDGWDNMPLDFCLLTGHTLTSPFADVLLDIWPHEFICNGLAGSLHAWMTEAMNHIKYAAAVG